MGFHFLQVQQLLACFLYEKLCFQFTFPLYVKIKGKKPEQPENISQGDSQEYLVCEDGPFGLVFVTSWVYISSVRKKPVTPCATASQGPTNMPSSV